MRSIPFEQGDLIQMPRDPGGWLVVTCVDRQKNEMITTFFDTLESAQEWCEAREKVIRDQVRSRCELAHSRGEEPSL